MTASRFLPTVVVALVAFGLGCTDASPRPPPEPPSAEEVRSFLSQAGEAAASDDDRELRQLCEKGVSYPDKELRMLKATQFWKLRPASRVERLGPDAFRIRLLPQQPERQGAISVRVHLELPVRRGKDGQLRILSFEESERLDKIPVAEDPEGEPVVELDFPEEGDFGRRAGSHYATELWVEAAGDDVCLFLRFDPPLLGPGLRADLPLSERQVFHFGEEIVVEMSLDADANGATGFGMEDFYRRLEGAEAFGSQRTKEWEGFGVEAKLTVDGKKFVLSDGGRAWGLRAKLRKVALRIERPGAWSDRGEVLFEKTHEDPEITVEHDTLTVRVPATMLPMRPDAAYRVMLEKNGSTSLMLKARKGRTVAGACSLPFHISSRLEISIAG